MISRTLVDEPPVSLSDGGAVREGVDAELDELRGLSSNGRQMIAAIEERERARTGIGSLKVRFNSVFGYYLEVTKANAKAVPADYERKQTLVNAERFTTPELKELETKILTAQERSRRDRAQNLCGAAAAVAGRRGACARDGAVRRGDRSAGLLRASRRFARMDAAGCGRERPAGVCRRHGIRWSSGGWRSKARAVCAELAALVRG